MTLITVMFLVGMMFLGVGVWFSYTESKSVLNKIDVSPEAIAKVNFKEFYELESEQVKLFANEVDKLSYDELAKSLDLLRADVDSLKKELEEMKPTKVTTKHDKIRYIKESNLGKSAKIQLIKVVELEDEGFTLDQVAEIMEVGKGEVLLLKNLLNMPME